MRWYIFASKESRLSNSIKSSPKFALSTFSHVINGLTILGVFAIVPLIALAEEAVGNNQPLDPKASNDIVAR